MSTTFSHLENHIHICSVVVGGDGSVYIGRGWDIKGGHTYRQNTASIGIGVIGSFSDKAPPKQQLDATQKLIASGVELKKLQQNYELYDMGYISQSNT